MKNNRLIYLDQNGLSILARRDQSELRSRFSRILAEQDLKIAIGFPHVYKTAKATDLKRQRLISFIDSIAWISLRPLIFIMRAEIQNEFYRFLNLRKRKNISFAGAIFPDVPQGNFSEWVSYARINSFSKNRYLQTCVDGHDKKMKDMVSTHSTDLTRERRAALVNFVNRELKDLRGAELPFELPRYSLDQGEFIKKFDWSACPYFSMYTAFQAYRYRDKKRMPSGDLGDAEHAVLAAVGCEYAILEKNAAEILKQASKVTYCSAIIFSSLQDFLRTAVAGQAKNPPATDLKQRETYSPLK